jgi:uncharacterized protein (DUF305 family)
MKPKNFLLTLTFGGIFSLLSGALVACTNTTQPNATTAGQDAAQQPSSMPGMSPGSEMPMPGMDHSSMNMSLGPKDINFNLLFIDAMTPHHEGGVVMAQEALQKSKRPEMKQLAQEIIDAQKKEIAQLKDWRKTWYPSAAETPMMYDAKMGQMGHMMPMSEQMRSGMMMSTGLGAADEQFDLRFINAMTLHHGGALTMAKEALEKSDRPEMKELAQNIIDSQQQEIDQMKQLRKTWYGQ